MSGKEKELSNRLLDFAVSVIKLADKMDKTTASKHIAGQLIRSVTSSGANYQEACGGESRKDFIHKLQISLKEMRESLYWLKLIERAILTAEPDIKILVKEADELTRILGKSIVTAKKG
jgi:four helix bundle protein